MKRILTVAALLLTACGAATSATGNLDDDSFTYMSDMRAALEAHDIDCADYTQEDAGVDTNIREVGLCPGFRIILMRISLQGDAMKPIRAIYAMKFPYAFVGANWVIGTDTEANAKFLTKQLHVEPYSG